MISTMQATITFTSAQLNPTDNQTPLPHHCHTLKSSITGRPITKARTIMPENNVTCEEMTVNILCGGSCTVGGISYSCSVQQEPDDAQRGCIGTLSA